MLVCDAASANVSTIKATCGESGAYGQTSNPVDSHKVSPFFQHPFDPATTGYVQAIKYVNNMSLNIRY